MSANAGKPNHQAAVLAAAQPAFHGIGDGPPNGNTYGKNLLRQPYERAWHHGG